MDYTKYILYLAGELASAACGGSRAVMRQIVNNKFSCYTVNTINPTEACVMNERMGLCMGMGLCIGIALSVAAGFQISWGMGIGLLIGTIIGGMKQDRA